MGAILQQILAVLIPPAATFAALQIAKLNGTIDGLPGVVKQLLAVVIASVLAAVGGFLKLPLPGNLGGLSSDIVSGLLAALAAMGVHAIYGAVRASPSKR